MTLPYVLAILLGLALTAYATMGGADFGAGILDLLARRRGEQRAALAHTIGPLWEANHVWLIFSITVLFSTFPTAFAALGTATLVPLTLAVMAIVVRGVTFALRVDPAGAGRGDRGLTRTFGAASLLAPFLFGACAAGLAVVSTRTGIPRTPGSVPWLSLFAVIVGVLAIALCAQMAASLMVHRLGLAGQTRLADDFRRRGLQATAAVLVLSALSLAVAAWRVPALWNRLSTTALPLLALGLAAMGASAYGFATRRHRLARGASAVVVGGILWGWLVAQAPHLVGTRLTIQAAAATPAAMTAFAISAGVVLVAVIPAFFLLYSLFRHPSPRSSDEAIPANS